MQRKRTDSTRRYQCARLICAYMHPRTMQKAVVTSRDVSAFPHRSLRYMRSISVFLNFLYTDRIHKSCFGFYIPGTSPLPKCGYPHHYTIGFISGARDGPDMRPDHIPAGSERRRMWCAPFDHVRQVCRLV
jgi:hypothetical protein